MQWIEWIFSSPAGLATALVAAAVLVVWAGSRLSLYGDALGERTGLGSGFAGLIFLAGVTSLPELVVSFTAATRASLLAAGWVDPVLRGEALRQGADLALGNMIGSNAFNLLILVVADGLYRKGSLYDVLQEDHRRPAMQGLVLVLLLGAGLLTSRVAPLNIPVLDAGGFTVLIAAAYLYFLRRPSAPVVEREPPAAALPAEQSLTLIPARRFYAVLTALAVVIVVAGAALSLLASRMALPPEQGGFGLQESFIGSVFLAVCTSLPELVVSISCVRLGFFDLSVSNVLGSNLFNMLIVFTSDIGLRGGSILQCAGPGHAVSLVAVMLMTLLTVWALKHRPRKSLLGMSPVSLLVLAVYLAAFGFSLL